MANPNSRQTLIDYCLRRLGEPVIEVNVDEDQIEELEYEECTEDQCIVMIQEALQIENLFILQVIGEGKDTQLTLKWFGLDNKNINYQHY